MVRLSSVSPTRGVREEYENSFMITGVAPTAG
jgi:hypothetical protein